MYTIDLQINNPLNMKGMDRITNYRIYGYWISGLGPGNLARYLTRTDFTRLGDIPLETPDPNSTCLETGFGSNLRKKRILYSTNGDPESGSNLRKPRIRIQPVKKPDPDPTYEKTGSEPLYIPGVDPGIHWFRALQAP